MQAMMKITTVKMVAFIHSLFSKAPSKPTSKSQTVKKQRKNHKHKTITAINPKIAIYIYHTI